ncbi:MAG: FAD-dependent oxidoreductase [Candidatus Nanopelagicales bacterium]
MREVVVIGADACGATAASAVKRGLGQDVHVLVLERQQWTSYSACGIPYWLSGEVHGPEGLVARTPEQHRDNGLDLRTGWEVTAIDPGRRTVTAVQASTGAEHTLGYDDLVIGTGATPTRPRIPGIDLPGVHGVHTLDDGLAVLDSLAQAQAQTQVRARAGAEVDSHPDASGSAASGSIASGSTASGSTASPGTADRPRAVVVGAGYIGIEMAEAMCARGLRTTVIDMAPAPMSTLDPDMGQHIATAMAALDITFLGGQQVQRFEAGPQGRVARVVTADSSHEADIVVLGLGVRPNSALARAAGLPIGQHGGILTDDHQRVLDHAGIWAGGDCVEVLDRVSGQQVAVALGTHANKHGRVIGANISGGDLVFPGIVGTAISKLCDLEVGRTGLREAQAHELGLDVRSVTITATTRAGYFPSAEQVTVKMIAEAGTGRLVGCQIVGGEGAGKRIDVAAAALWNELTVEDLTSMDLAYAPPMSPLWDPVQVAARKLAGMQPG